MSTIKAPPITHITLNTVSDDIIEALYDSHLLNHLDIKGYIKYFVPSTKRRLDFFQSAAGVGIELAAGPFYARLFLDPNEQHTSGYVTSFEGLEKRGLLRTFNSKGDIRNVSGQWTQDDVTDYEVFIKTDRQHSIHPEDHINKNATDRSLHSLSNFIVKHMHANRSPA